MTIMLLTLAFAVALLKNATQMMAGTINGILKPSEPLLEEADRSTIYLSYTALWVALIASRPPDNDLISLAGIALVIAGAVLSFFAIRKLGRWHSEYIAPITNAPLATSGIYAWMRHPMRTGFFLEISGLALVLRRPWAIAVWAGVGILLALRTKREERLLAQHYGDAYRAYRTSVRITPLFLFRMRARRHRGT